MTDWCANNMLPSCEKGMMTIFVNVYAHAAHIQIRTPGTVFAFQLDMSYPTMRDCEFNIMPISIFLTASQY